MPEKLHEILNRISGILHWLGKYHESNALSALSAFLLKHNIYYSDQLEPWNSPVVTDLCEQNSELLDLIEAAAESDEPGCYKLIADYNNKTN